MMDLLLLSNNLSSGLVVVSSWWLAHEYAQNRWRWTASLIGIIGWSVLVTALARNIGIDPRWPIVFTKFVLGATFLFLLHENGLAHNSPHFERKPERGNR